jgi:transcription elongation factor Elf1
MSSERDIVIECWNCHKKFTVPASELNPAMTIYKGQTPSTRPIESRTNKKRLLKTCPYCGKENEIYV